MASLDPDVSGERLYGDDFTAEQVAAWYALGARYGREHWLEVHFALLADPAGTRAV